MHTTPISLLERLRQPSEEAAWGRFVELYTPLLYSWTRRLGLQDSDCADLVQEVFTVLVGKMPQFRYDPDKSFRAWLWTVLYNKWRSSRRRQTEASLEDVVDPHDPDGAGSLEEAEYRRQLVSRALQLMRTDFEPTTWTACWQFVVGGRPAAQVAAELGISPNAVYIAKCRVLRRLRKELDGLID